MRCEQAALLTSRPHVYILWQQDFHTVPGYTPTLICSRRPPGQYPWSCCHSGHRQSGWEEWTGRRTLPRLVLQLPGSLTALRLRVHNPENCLQARSSLPLLERSPQAEPGLGHRDQLQLQTALADSRAGCEAPPSVSLTIRGPVYRGDGLPDSEGQAAELDHPGRHLFWRNCEVGTSSPQTRSVFRQSSVVGCV